MRRRTICEWFCSTHAGLLQSSLFLSYEDCVSYCSLVFFKETFHSFTMLNIHDCPNMVTHTLSECKWSASKHVTLTHETLMAVTTEPRILRGHRTITRTLPITSGMRGATATLVITGGHGKVLLFLVIVVYMATRGQHNCNILMFDRSSPSHLHKGGAERGVSLRALQQGGYQNTHRAHYAAYIQEFRHADIFFWIIYRHIFCECLRYWHGYWSIRGRWFSTLFQLLVTA